MSQHLQKRKFFLGLSLFFFLVYDANIVYLIGKQYLRIINFYVIMELYWKNKKIKEFLEDPVALRSEYGRKVAKKVAQRISELQSFPTYADLPPSTRKHSIKDGKSLRYMCVDLPHEGGGRGKWRLAFVPYGEYEPANQKTISSIEIIGIINHHK